jgi:serine phosphatase RsbU (regulator of sigma subunit)
MIGMERLLISERNDPFLYATVCDISIDLNTGSMKTLLHGHPAPVLLSNGPQWIFPSTRTIPLGVDAKHAPATPIIDELGDDWSVLLLTDGVYEGKAGAGRLGESGLIDVLQRNASLRGGTLLDAVIDDVQSINGGDLDDDLAMVWFGSRP